MASLVCGGAVVSVVDGLQFVEDCIRGAIRTWEWNREVDPERVARIVADQMARHRACGAFDAFSTSPMYLATLAGPGPGQCFLVDGQHRRAAFCALRDMPELAEACADVKMIVITTACDSQAAIDHLFRRINVGTPVPAAYYDHLVRDEILKFADRLEVLYAAAVRVGARPMRPYFNAKLVIDEISSIILVRDLIVDRKLTCDHLFEVAEAENVVARLKFENDRSGEAPRCAAGAVKSNFYLGLRKDGWATAVALQAAGRINADAA